MPPVITTALTASLVSGVLVLLVVCANVASLILAQASARTREVAVRAALGAGRWRLIRQSVTEGIVLALVAAVLGAWIAVLGVRWTRSWIPVDPPYLFAMGGWNPVGGIYTLGIALLAGLVGAKPRLGRPVSRPLVNGQGAHGRASRARSGALGVPAERPRGFGAKPRLIRTTEQRSHPPTGAARARATPRDSSRRVVLS